MAARIDAAPQLALAPAQRAVWRRALRLVRRKPVGAFSLALLLFLVVIAVGADVIAPRSPYDSFPKVLLDPAPEFPFGTDHVGRDVLSRVIHGARISLGVGVGSVAIAVFFGSLLGITSGYFEGRTDMVIQRIMDAQLAIPTIVLAMVIMAVIGPGVLNIILAIGISLMPNSNRVVRSAVLAEKGNVYVEAAHAVGCSSGRIMLRHLLPNVTAPIIVVATVSIAVAIIVEASLSFIGVGIPAPEPSWGLMLGKETRKFMLAQPWLAVWPGLAISVAVLAWNMLGDALRDLWDPRLRGTE